MSSHSMGTIRKFKTARFTVVVDAIEDDSSLDDLASDDDAQKELAENLDSGRWTLFCARVRVYLDGAEVASDYLGGCVYADIADFQDHRQCAAATRAERAKGRADVVVGKARIVWIAAGNITDR